MRKITFGSSYGFVCLALLMMLPVFVSSQVRLEDVEKPKVCEEKAKDETRWMTKNLYLSSDQYDRVQTLNLYYTCLLESLNNLADKKLVSKKKAELLKSKDAEFRAVLSSEQFVQYKTRKEKKIVQKKSPFAG